MELAEDKIVTYGTPEQEQTRLPLFTDLPLLAVMETANHCPCQLCGKPSEDVFCSDLCLLAWHDMRDANL